jgi:hypothetical protein
MRRRQISRILVALLAWPHAAPRRKTEFRSHSSTAAPQPPVVHASDRSRSALGRPHKGVTMWLKLFGRLGILTPGVMSSIVSVHRQNGLEEIIRNRHDQNSLLKCSLFNLKEPCGLVST